MRSWRKTANIFLYLILALAVALLLWTNWYYGREIYSTVQKENRDYLSSWAQYLDTSLDAAYEHVYGLAAELNRKTELRSGSPRMDPMLWHEINDSMEDDLAAIANLDCLFVLDADTDQMLYRSNVRLSSAVSQEIRAALPEVISQCATSVGDRDWSLRTVGSRLYYVKTVYIGKYRVGALCGADHLRILRLFPALGEDVALLLVTGEEVFCAEGDPAWAGELVRGPGDRLSMPGMALLSQPVDRIGATAVLAADTNNVLKEKERLSVLMLISVSVLFLTMLLLLDWLLRVKVVRPTEILLDANNELSAGHTQRRITEEAGSREFKRLFDSFNNMADQIMNLRIERYDRALRERENDLRLLRAQIKPHFYLNAITTIYNMTYQGRMDNIRQFSTTLAKFMRYMLGLKSSWTTIGEELAHIGNYVDMQTLRFPGSVELETDCPKEAAGVRIPMLMIFTVVENTFKHAMSLYDCMKVTIRVRRVEEEGFSGFAVVIEDNGDGFPENVIEEMNAPVRDSITAKEHLGLSNVRYTMAIQYKTQGLLRLSNRPEGGARVELRIPDSRGEETEP